MTMPATLTEEGLKQRLSILQQDLAKEFSPARIAGILDEDLKTDTVVFIIKNSYVGTYMPLLKTALNYVKATRQDLKLLRQNPEFNYSVREFSVSIANDYHYQLVLAALALIPEIEILEAINKTRRLHLGGKIQIRSNAGIDITNDDDSKRVYTPGVADIVMEIARNPESVYDLTTKGNRMAVISDGSAILGLGNQGGAAFLPVGEGKCIFLNQIFQISAEPIVLKFQDAQKTIETIENISPSFGFIMLEDFKSPECFDIEEALQNIGVPVFHDDQHGTAIAVTAGLEIALTLVNKQKTDSKIVINGIGAAGTATAIMLAYRGFQNILLCDVKGDPLFSTANPKRPLSSMTLHSGLAHLENHHLKLLNQPGIVALGQSLSMHDALRDADIFIGFSAPNILEVEDIHNNMADQPIVFALANPNPEISIDAALDKANVAIFATGGAVKRSTNRINNAIAFPGLVKAAMDLRLPAITIREKSAVIDAIIDYMQPLKRKSNIFPSYTDINIHRKIVEVVRDLHKDDNPIHTERDEINREVSNYIQRVKEQRREN